MADGEARKPCPHCGGHHEPSKQVLEMLDWARHDVEAIADPKVRAGALAHVESWRRESTYISLDECPAWRPRP